MAVTAQKSTQVTNVDNVPSDHNATYDWHGRMRVAFFDFTQSGAGDANSTIAMIDLPAGKVRLILPLSRIYFSGFGSGTNMDLGWQAYTDDDGSSVAADPNGLDDGIDVSSAGSVNPGGTVGTHETKLFESQAGVRLEAQITDAGISDTDTLSGYWVYILD